MIPSVPHGTAHVPAHCAMALRTSFFALAHVPWHLHLNNVLNVSAHSAQVPTHVPKQWHKAHLIFRRHMCHGTGARKMCCANVPCGTLMIPKWRRWFWMNSFWLFKINELLLKKSQTPGKNIKCCFSRERPNLLR